MLFKDDIKFQLYASLTQETFAAAKSTIEQVETKHLLPILGEAQYNELSAAYTAESNENNLPARLKTLLDLSRKVIGPWTCVYYTPITDVKVSEAGARRLETDKAKTAFQYQVRNFIHANQIMAMDAEEFLLQFLEMNPADYPLWVSSPANEAYKSLLIKTAKEFNELFVTPAAHSNYRAIRSKMVDIENIAVPNAIGSNIFSPLREKIKNGDVLTQPEKDLLFAIKKAVAALAISEAIPFINLRMDETGITAAGGNLGQDSNLNSRIPAPENSLNLLKTSTADTGRSWLNKARQIIKDNPVTWPPAPTEETLIKTPYKTVFGL